MSTVLGTTRPDTASTRADSNTARSKLPSRSVSPARNRLPKLWPASSPVVNRCWKSWPTSDSSSASAARQLRTSPGAGMREVAPQPAAAAAVVGRRHDRGHVGDPLQAAQDHAETGAAAQAHDADAAAGADSGPASRRRVGDQRHPVRLARAGRRRPAPPARMAEHEQPRDRQHGEGAVDRPPPSRRPRRRRRASPHRACPRPSTAGTIGPAGAIRRATTSGPTSRARGRTALRCVHLAVADVRRRRSVRGPSIRVCAVDDEVDQLVVGQRARAGSTGRRRG